jgi:hypothetical protein
MAHNFRMLRGTTLGMTSQKNKTVLPKPLSVFMYRPSDGHVAEWLRSGLQNRLPRFNSGRGLQRVPNLLDGRRKDKLPRDCRNLAMNVPGHPLSDHPSRSTEPVSQHASNGECACLPLIALSAP